MGNSPSRAAQPATPCPLTCHLPFSAQIRYHQPPHPNSGLNASPLWPSYLNATTSRRLRLGQLLAPSCLTPKTLSSTTHSWVPKHRLLQLSAGRSAPASLNLQIQSKAFPKPQCPGLPVTGAASLLPQTGTVAWACPLSQPHLPTRIAQRGCGLVSSSAGSQAV